MAEAVQNSSPPQDPEDTPADDSLDNPSGVPSAAAPGSSETNNDTSDSNETKVTTEDVKEQDLEKLRPNLLHRILERFNPYIFVLILLVMIAIIVVLIAYFGSQSGTNTSKLLSQNLSTAALQQLANNDTNVGSSNQVLNVESSSIFSGNILARQALQVAGNLTVGGTLALNNLSVNGAGQFGQLNINKNLSVAGDSNVQGNSNIGKNLQVSGGATFGSGISAPQITTGNLQLNGDLVITHHIDTGGSIPSAHSGSALGTSGTVSISGSDTSGSLSINTGSNAQAGCFATVNFSAAFNKTPYVQVTPVGFAAGGLAYYISRSSSSFSICDATTPPANASFGFDYFVLD